MIKKLSIKENINSTEAVESCISWITDNINTAMSKSANKLTFSGEYKAVSKLRNEVSELLSNSGFKTIDATYDNEGEISTWTFERREAGTCTTIMIIDDESDWDMGRLTVDVRVKEIVNDFNESVDFTNEPYNSNWVEDASNSEDLYNLVDSLGRLDVLAEGIYKAVKNSPDRYNTNEVESLTQQIDKIADTLNSLKSDWESDSMSI